MKKAVFIVLLCSLCVSVVFSNTWNLSEESGSTLLEDETGKAVELFSSTRITTEEVDTISTVLDTIWAIPGLNGTRGRVTIEPGDYYHFILYPDSFIYNGIEFKDYMLSGLSFRYESALFYDITLKVGDFLPRSSGAYVSPNDFLEQLYSVYILPELYVQGDVLLQRIERLENALMAISKKGLFSKSSEVKDEIVIAVVLLHNENPNITIKEATDVLKEQGLDASKKDVEAVFMVYLGKFE